MPPALLPIFPGKIEHDATNGNLQQQRSHNRAQADALLFTDNRNAIASNTTIPTTLLIISIMIFPSCQ